MLACAALVINQLNSAMKQCFGLLTLAVIAGMSGPAWAGDVSGKVKLEGTPPAPKMIPLDTDPTCKVLNLKPTPTRHYIVSPDGGLANVFVYIKEVPGGKKYDPPADMPELDQKGCMYEPYAMGVMVNQKFKIHNSDPVMHNVNAGYFNFAQTSQGQETIKSFSKPEVAVKFMCNVHPWMFAFVGVFEHPFFAVTDKDGNYKLPSGLPAGDYTLVAWHPKAGESTQKITVGADDKKTADFTLKVK